MRRGRQSTRDDIDRWRSGRENHRMQRLRKRGGEGGGGGGAAYREHLTAVS